MAAIHRPGAHPFLAGLLRRLQAIEPRIQPGVTAVYEGEADGIDKDARVAAEALGIEVADFPISPAEWDRHGTAAGPMRNSAMLRGDHRGRTLAPAEAVLSFAGGSGTANMRKQGLAAGLPVVDITTLAETLAPLQRWTKHDAWLLRSDRKRCLEVQSTRPGIGPPIVSGHWLKVDGRIVMTPWCLYVGRDAHGLTGHPRLHNPFPIRPLTGDMVEVRLREGPVQCTRAEALGYYRAHLEARLITSPALRRELAAIVVQRRVLVCWCGESKPCHACMIAEFAVAEAAKIAFDAAVLAN